MLGRHAQKHARTARDLAPRGNPYKMRQKSAAPAPPGAPPPTPPESQWKLFTELDMHEESEMLELSAFLTTLQEAFASDGERGGSKRASMKILEEEDDDAAARPSEVYSPLSAEALANASAAREDDGFEIHRGSSFICAEALKGFAIPKGPVTARTMESVIEVLRRGGDLAPKSALKLLRDAYKKLKRARNVTRVAVPPRARVHVVGDLHGQLPDLLHILDDAGLPSATNRFVFNGDFVDRGPAGVEVMLALLALFLGAEDGAVCLNRGNHEDASICSMYGFLNECCAKYDQTVFNVFVEVFKHLPLATLLGDGEVLVIHGGLFHRERVTLAQLDACARAEYVPVPPDADELRSSVRLLARAIR